MSKAKMAPPAATLPPINFDDPQWDEAGLDGPLEKAVQEATAVFVQTLLNLANSYPNPFGPSSLGSVRTLRQQEAVLSQAAGYMDGYVSVQVQDFVKPLFAADAAKARANAKAQAKAKTKAES